MTLHGKLRDCILLSYRTPAAGVNGLLPPGLVLVTKEGWAFWSVVACRIDAMRPRGVPAALGLTYRHVAYRLYVRATTATGETVEGIYFVQSDADSAPIVVGGNRLSDFRFHHARIDLRVTAREVSLAVGSRARGETARLRAVVGAASDPPPGSPFATRAEAVRFLKYRPLGLAVRGGRLDLAEVFRDEDAWHETPLRVTEAHWGFFDRLGQKELHLEHAVLVAPIEYRWRLGRSVAVVRCPSG